MAISLKKIISYLERKFNILIKPKSKDEEGARKERILNILLLCAFFLSTVASLSATISYSIDVRTNSLYRGIGGLVVGFFVLFFFFLYFLSRAGFSKLIAKIFVLFFFFSAFYTSFRWGANVPQSILINALIIVMAGILVNTKFAFLMVFLILTSSFFLLELVNKGFVKYNLLWATTPPRLEDILINFLSFLIIAVVSWLYNREIIKSLQRARNSERELQKERDNLEIRVEERTKELKQAQLEKVVQLYKFADFGRLATGLFHDLVTPLNVVSLNLENIKEQTNHLTKEKPIEIKQALKRATVSTKIMEEFVKSVRLQIQGQQSKKIFSLNKEIFSVIENLYNKAINQKVEIIFENKNKILTYGNQLRFHQVITNLISNAIDSYSKIKRHKNRKILVRLYKQKNNIILEVEDFGVGIADKNLERIFEPFYTTKNINEGMGIGLTICRDIIERNFDGKISVKSKNNIGTKFTIEFPKKTNV